MREIEKASGSGSRACMKLRKSQALAAGHAWIQESLRIWQQGMHESAEAGMGRKKGGELLRGHGQLKRNPVCKFVATRYAYTACAILYSAWLKDQCVKEHECVLVCMTSW